MDDAIELVGCEVSTHSYCSIKNSILTCKLKQTGRERQETGRETGTQTGRQAHTHTDRRGNRQKGTSADKKNANENKRTKTNKTNKKEEPNKRKQAKRHYCPTIFPVPSLFFGDAFTFLFVCLKEVLLVLFLLEKKGRSFKKKILWFRFVLVDEFFNLTLS